MPLLEDIAQAAVDVRQKQKTYFKERTQSNLQAAKAAESKLDKLLDVYLVIMQWKPPEPATDTPRQGSLFDT